jgi:hypothetical protein
VAHIFILSSFENVVSTPDSVQRQMRREDNHELRVRKKWEEGGCYCHSVEETVRTHEELIKIVELRFELGIFRIQIWSNSTVLVSSVIPHHHSKVTVTRMNLYRAGWPSVSSLHLHSRAGWAESRPRTSYHDRSFS